MTAATATSPETIRKGFPLSISRRVSRSSRCLLETDIDKSFRMVSELGHSARRGRPLAGAGQRIASRLFFWSAREMRFSLKETLFVVLRLYQLRIGAIHRPNLPWLGH
jgi:hypothetical protein